MTFSEIEAIAIGTAPSVTWTIYYGAAFGTGGTSIGTATTNGGSSPAVDTVSASATVPADNFVWLTTGAISGTVTQFGVTLTHGATAMLPPATESYYDGSGGAQTFTNLLTTLTNISLTPGAGIYLVTFNCTMSGSAVSNVLFYTRANGTAITNSNFTSTAVTTNRTNVSWTCKGTVGAGEVFDIQALRMSGSATISIWDKSLVCLRVGS
jgi:hypothetical protein